MNRAVRVRRVPPDRAAALLVAAVAAVTAALAISAATGPTVNAGHPRPVMADYQGGGGSFGGGGASGTW